MKEKDVVEVALLTLVIFGVAGWCFSRPDPYFDITIWMVGMVCMTIGIQIYIPLALLFTEKQIGIELRDRLWSIMAFLALVSCSLMLGTNIQFGSIWLIAWNIASFPLATFAIYWVCKHANYEAFAPAHT